MARLGSRFVASALLAALSTVVGPAVAQRAGPPPLAPLEPFKRRTVAQGETCAELARELYGSADPIALLSRYQPVSCPRPRAGQVLLVPTQVGGFPQAAVRAADEGVESRPDAAGAWAAPSVGALLEKGAEVRVGAKGRAQLELLGGARAQLEADTLARVGALPGEGALELESGEVRLMGGARPVTVSLPGGARVVASSTDFVVERRGEQTTVVVYEGTARVENGKKRVELARHQSTRLAGKDAPSAPRALAAAPELADEPALVLAPMALTLRWAEVAGAKAYRVELAREGDLHAVVRRADLPPSERAYRAEGLPAGRYSARVLARDATDTLGAAQGRALLVVGVTEGRVKGDALEVHPYGHLALEPLDVLEASLDGRTFVRVEGPLDVARLRPALAVAGGPAPAASPALWLRAAGIAAVRVSLSVLQVEVDLGLRRTPDGLDVTVRFPELPEGAWDRLRPKLVGLLEEGPPVALGDVPLDGALRIERQDLVAVVVVDGEGRELARRGIPRPAPAPEAPRPPAPKYLGIAGLTADLPTDAAGPWLPPLPRGAGLIGVMVSSRESGAVTVALYTFGGYSFGPVTLDAIVQSPGLDAPGAEAFAAPGVRVRAFNGTDFQLGAGARVYLPLIEQGPPVRIEPTLSLGGTLGKAGLLGNLGVRFRVGDVSLLGPVPDANVFATLGAWYDVTKWLRAYGVADLGALVDGDGFQRMRGGARGGLEAGTDIFVSASGYVGSGLSQAHASGQLSVGFRRP